MAPIPLDHSTDQITGMTAANVGNVWGTMVAVTYGGTPINLFFAAHTWVDDDAFLAAVRQKLTTAPTDYKLPLGLIGDGF